MKDTKSSRWVLAGISSLVVLTTGIVVAANLLPDFYDAKGGLVSLILAVLTGVIAAPLPRLQGKRIIVVMTALFILTCLFPPWLNTVYITGTRDDAGMRAESSAGYYFLLTPPTSGGDFQGYGVKLDLKTLILEWLCISVAGGLIWIIVGTGEKRPDGSPNRFRDVLPTEDESDSPQNEPQTPRSHHYQFAYKELPGLAFSDPYVPLGFGNDTPKGSLIKFWKQVGTQFPEKERVNGSGLFAKDSPFGPDYVILLVTMPVPLRDSEAHYVAIIYPKSWFNSPDYENSRPELQIYILSKGNVPNADGTSGGILRKLNKTGHGAIKYGVAATVEAFCKEIQTDLLSPGKCITRVDSTPSNFTTQEVKPAKPILPAQFTDRPDKTGKQKQIRIVILDDEICMQQTYALILKRDLHPEPEILEFDHGDEAWEELSRTGPDLFITDINHVGMTCKEMLIRLHERKANYPVLVISAALGGCHEEMMKRDWKPNLNVSFISKPYELVIFRKTLETVLKIKIQRASRQTEQP